MGSTFHSPIGLHGLLRGQLLPTVHKPQSLNISRNIPAKHLPTSSPTQFSFNGNRAALSWSFLIHHFCTILPFGAIYSENTCWQSCRLTKKGLLPNNYIKETSPFGAKLSVQAHVCNSSGLHKIRKVQAQKFTWEVSKYNITPNIQRCTSYTFFPVEKSRSVLNSRDAHLSNSPPPKTQHPKLDAP
jgi:hypothetical protein